MTETDVAALAACPRCGAPAQSSDVFCRRCGFRRLPPPGWHPNPDGCGGVRFWDGTTWTRHTHGTRASAPEPRPTPGSGSPDNDAPAPGLPGVGVAGIGFAVGALAGRGVISLLQHHGRPGGTLAELLLSELVLWIGLLAPVFYVSRRRGTGSLARDFGLRFRTVDLGIGTLGAIIGRSLTVMVVLPLYAAFHDLLNNPSVGVNPTTLSGGLLAAYAVLACVGAPIIEELLFRGLIQTRLVARWGVGRGIAVTSVLFGAAHLIGWAGPASLLAVTGIAAGGLVLGYIRQRTGRLGTSMVAHSLFNAVAVVLVAAGVGQ